MDFQGIVLSVEDQTFCLLDSSISQSEPLFIRKQARVGGYREFVVFRGIEKAILNKVENTIFVQKLTSALNYPPLHAPYSKFIGKSIKYLVSYGGLKEAPRRLDTAFFPR